MKLWYLYLVIFSASLVASVVRELFQGYSDIDVYREIAVISVLLIPIAMALEDRELTER